MKHIDDGVHDPIVLLLDIVDAFDAQANVAVDASLVRCIFFVDSSNASFIRMGDS